MKILILVLALWPCVTLADKLTLQEKVDFFYPNIVKQVQNHGLSGPIAHEAAQYAQLRCIHEDGPDRPHDISYNGMVPGSPNKEVMEKLYMPDCKLGRVSSYDGQGSYSITGPRAHIMASTAIALWYDSMINSDRYRICSQEERRLWNESRWCSHMIAINHHDILYRIKFDELKEKRDRVLQKVNSAYGPQGPAITQQRRKLFSIN
jgi:hypothetical protein